MIKRKIMRKLIVTSSILFAFILVYFIPKDKELKNVKEELEYNYKDVVKETIYLLDNNNYLGKAEIALSTNDTVTMVRELLETLITDGIGEDKIPNGFTSIIPSDTKINSIELDKGILKVDFSKELLDVKKELEEKVIESIIYTVTEVKEIDKVVIFVDGKILTKLPKSNINLPTTLDRSFGINKKYDITTFKDITPVTIYYINKHNNNTYYVPVTKYINDDREKIEIIIDELTTSPIYTSNLMSYLNSNTKLLKSNIDKDLMSLEFNDYIFNDYEDKKILEEVIYTISLSIYDNYNVHEVSFINDSKEVYTSSYVDNDLVINYK
ncbi:MAG: GerMN domain-containing protein [Bacillales bacterium]|nr:GerMN domain-containing protein [Bacillales bacterium]